jgi:hypothetical protein
MSDNSAREQLLQLSRRVDDVDARLARIRSDVDDLATAATAQTGGPGSAAEVDPPAPEPVYECVDDWVRDFYLPTFIRPIGGDIRWCAEWQQHNETRLRFEAMWRSWEALRLDGGLGLSTWLVNHLDPNAAILLSRCGPFAQCTPDRHQ